MQNPQITIEKIRLKDLVRFADRVATEPAFARTSPISRIRAASQIQNPAASPEDVVLLVAFHQNICVGYHGLLPNVFKYNGHESVVYWGSTIFVAPDYRDKGISKLLLEEIKSTGIDSVFGQATPYAEQAYLATGFQNMVNLIYYQLRVDRLNNGPLSGDWLPWRRPVSHPSRPDSSVLARINRLFYSISKKMFYRRLLNRADWVNKGVRWQAVDQLSNACERLLAKRENVPYFLRDLKSINWMLAHPWIRSAGDGHVKQDHYYFTTVREMFRYVALEISMDGEPDLKGFMVLSISSKKGKTRIKILDTGFKDSAVRNIVGYLALRYARSVLADRIEFPAEFRPCFEAPRRLKRFIKKQTRTHLFYPKNRHSPLLRYRDKIAFHYCDGDTTFT